MRIRTNTNPTITRTSSTKNTLRRILIIRKQIKFSLLRRKHFMVLYLRKKISLLYVFEDKRCYKRIPIFYKNKVHFVDTLSRRKYFWDTAVPCGSENSHNVVQLNRDEDKYYLLTPYPTLMQPLKKFSPKSIRAIARNPNIDLQSIGIYSKSDIEHHIRTKQFQELITQMDTIQRQSIDQNLRKVTNTARFADI